MKQTEIFRQFDAKNRILEEKSFIFHLPAGNEQTIDTVIYQYGYTDNQEGLVKELLVEFSYNNDPFHPAEKITYEYPLSTDHQKIPAIEVYPNPSDRTFYVQGVELTGRKTYFELLDRAGRIIESGQLNPTGIYPLDLDELPDGLYLIKIMTDEGVRVVKKLVKSGGSAPFF